MNCTTICPITTLLFAELQADGLGDYSFLVFLLADIVIVIIVIAASRTADIERVLALGVHGPLELHILILEEA